MMTKVFTLTSIIAAEIGGSVDSHPRSAPTVS
jgi:hypothetical protein